MAVGVLYDGNQGGQKDMSSIQCRFCTWLRRYLFQPLCGELLFNSDMSVEIDRLLADNERLQSLVDSIEAELK